MSRLVDPQHPAENSASGQDNFLSLSGVSLGISFFIIVFSLGHFVAIFLYRFILVTPLKKKSANPFDTF